MRKSKQIVSLLAPCLALALVLIADCQTPLLAQEAVTQQSAESQLPDEAKPLFSLPKAATAAELFEFINQVKRTPAKTRTREAMLAHGKLQIQAVLAACNKLIEGKPDVRDEIGALNEQLAALEALSQVDMAAAAAPLEKLWKALEADTRPEVGRFLAQKKLEKRAATVSELSEAQQVAFIDELFAVSETSGLDRRLYSVLSGIGRTVARTGNPKVAVELYKRLADAMEKSQDPPLVQRAKTTRGTARRLELPGSFMEVTGQTADGDQFDWAAYRGKVVLVDFWASWCGPCRREIPNMKRQLAKYGKKGFAIVGVNLDTTQAAYQEYVDQNEIKWTNLMSDKQEERGWDNPLAAHYGVSGIPTAILVDQRGIVVSMSARGPRLQRLLQDLLGPDEEANPKEIELPLETEKE